MPIPTASAPLRAVLDLVVARALRRPGALFIGARRVWALPVLDELHAHVLAGYRAPAQTFDERWALQLEGISEEGRQLAGELLYAHMVVAKDLSGATKRRLLGTTLAPSRHHVRVPPALDAVLDGGLCRTGIAFKARRGAQLRLLLETALSWRGQDAATRRELLAEPFSFKHWLHRLPLDGAQSQRELLLHVVHPAAFEPIASAGLKARLVDAHAWAVPAAVVDVDEALQWVRRAVEEEHGPGIPLVELVDGSLSGPQTMRVRGARRGSTAGAAAPPAGPATSVPATPS